MLINTRPSVRSYSPSSTPVSDRPSQLVPTDTVTVSGWTRQSKTKALTAASMVAGAGAGAWLVRSATAGLSGAGASVAGGFSGAVAGAAGGAVVLGVAAGAFYSRGGDGWGGLAGASAGGLVGGCLGLVGGAVGGAHLATGAGNLLPTVAGAVVGAGIGLAVVIASKR